ncbi:MAG: protein kinase [Thermoanaerobaculia bacterium]
MPLARGTRLGPYEILGPIGAGGMGEVWRARDTKLARDVALKVLPDHLADDPRALARFESEAKAVAALSHPHILAIHDFGRIGGVSFVVTELLEGETLRAALRNGGLPLRKALDIAAQLADALAAAHEKAIVHRDVKPENVFLARDGRARLLDFGLARDEAALRAADETHTPTVSVATEPGSVVGTVAYMSPEQSRGTPLDHRSDQFSLGVVLYEMLAGRRPFRGDSAAETLTAIIRADPEPVAKYAPSTPAPVRWILDRLLAKDPADRYESTRDLARDLETCRLHATEATTGPAESAPGGGAVPRKRRRAGFAVAALALASGLAGGYWLGVAPGGRTRSPKANVPRLVQLTWEPGRETDPAISPDGGSFAYVAGPTGQRDIFVRRVGGESSTNLTGNFPGDDLCPSFSPDGRSIAFRSEREGGGIFLMGATGESPRRLTEFGFDPKWSPDGKEIAFATHPGSGGNLEKNEIWIADVATGADRKLYDGDGRSPCWSPSGRRIAFHQQPTEGSPSLSSVAASGGSPTVIVPFRGETSALPFWSEAGIAFVSRGGGAPNVWRVRVDEASGKPVEEAAPLLTAAESTSPASTPDGRRLVCIFRSDSWRLDRWAFDPVRGRVEGAPQRIHTDPRQMSLKGISPDGEWLALLLWDADGQRDIFLVQALTGETRRLTNDGLREDFFVWSSDGSRLYFGFFGGSGETWGIRPDGSGREVVVPPAGEEPVVPEGASPDGRFLYVAVGKDYRFHLVDLNLAVGQRRPEPLPSPRNGRHFHPVTRSSDGRWLAGYPIVPAGERRPLLLFDAEKRSYESLLEVESDSPCSFLPDGRRILLYQRSGQLEILDRVTRKRAAAGSLPGEMVSFVLSADGRSLFTRSAIRESDAWMLDFGSKR